MISADTVVFDYPAARALHGVSFMVERGAVLALVGPNGAGKSTLMRCMAALDRPTSGRLTVAWGGKQRSSGSYWLVWPKNRPARPALASLTAWLASQVKG